jgi:threonine synthase
MRFVSTRGKASAASLGTALFDGLAPDGGLYVPDTIEAWSEDEIAGIPSRSLPELGVRVLKPFAAGGIDAATLTAVAVAQLSVPLIEIGRGFPRRAFRPDAGIQDIGARCGPPMAARGADVGSLRRPAIPATSPTHFTDCQRARVVSLSRRA